MKHAARFITILLCAVLAVCALAGCGEKGSLCTLEEAFDNGWLTTEDLQKIADLHNNKMSPEEPLDESVEKSIIRQVVKDFNDDLDKNIDDSVKDLIPKDYWATTDDVTITHYFGTYNGNVVVIIDNKKQLSFTQVVDEWQEICGVNFHFVGSSIYTITVWHEN